MVEIKYFDDKPKLFELSFKHKEYIATKFYEFERDFAEEKFFIDLFRRNSILVTKAYTYLFDVTYGCSYNGILFEMFVDEGYGFVWFCVQKPEEKYKLAELLKTLVENEKIK